MKLPTQMTKLLAIKMAINLGAYMRLRGLHVVADNLAATWFVLSLSDALWNLTIGQIPRRIAHLLWWCNIHMKVSSVPSI